MKNKLLEKKQEAIADVEYYEDQLKRAKIKVELIDEMIDELEEDAEDATEATTPNNLY